MLRPRIIPSLLLSRGGLVKTVRFRDPKYVGDPINTVRLFNEKEVDEIAVFDIAATVSGTAPDFELIEKIAIECRMPMCYCGGVKSVAEVERLVSLGVEKIALSSVALQRPGIITEAGRGVGSQSIVVVLDVKRSPSVSGFEVYTHNGNRATGRCPIETAKLMEDLGAGEILLNSIDRDGTLQGYDGELATRVRAAVGLPLTFLGGAGSIEHIKALVSSNGVIGAAAGSLFVFKGSLRAVLINYPVRSIRDAVANVVAAPSPAPTRAPAEPNQSFASASAAPPPTVLATDMILGRVQKKRLLFIGPLPDPITGQSLASQVLLEDLNKHYAVQAINLSKQTLVSGVIALGRILGIIKILREVRSHHRNSALIYLTVSESIPGNLRDLLVYFLCRRKLSRIIIHVHGGSLERAIFKRSWILRRLNQHFLCRIGGGIVLGSSHLGLLRNMMPPERVWIVPNFAQNYLFCSNDEIHGKYDSQPPLQVVYLSNLIAGKGFNDLAGGYKMLNKSEQERIQLHFAGAFEDEKSKQEFLASVATLVNVRYHGAVGGDAKRKLLQRSHLFCLPTRLNEGQPISILEAYAAGCAVVTTNCGGIPDVFQNGVNGYSITAGAPESIAAALRQCLLTASDLRLFGLHNASTARRLYREQYFTRRVVEVLQNVLLNVNRTT